MTIELDKEIEEKYEILAIMGEGGMGAVYKVRHRYLEEIQVIKLMRHQLQGSENVRARFLREARTAKKLRHPNIAEVMDYDVTSGGTAFIVMEFVEGTNLRELMARSGGKFEPRFVAEAGLQALSALEYLHGKGFVHRDISPDNLMVTDGKAVIKLIDLGIAKSIEATSNLTVDGKFIGKILYASPEQFGGEIDRRSDIYSLGVTLYELLTGTTPITGSDYRSLLGAVLTRPPRSFDETDPQGVVPAPLREAILKSLEKDPDHRFPTAEAFASALRVAMPDVQLVTDQSAITTQITTSPAREEDRKTEVLSDESEAATVVPTIASESGSTATIITEEKSTPPSTRRYVLKGAIAATVLLAAIVTAWQLQVDRKPTTPPPRKPVPIQTGELVIKGLPWGEVVEVLDTAGKNQITARLYTPAVLELPAGTYRVRVSNPLSVKKTDVVEATVTPGKIANYCEVKLPTLDAATYLKEVMR